MTSVAGTVRSYTEYLFFHTKKRREIVLLTPQLAEIVERSGIRDGFYPRVSTCLLLSKTFFKFYF